MKGSSVAIGQAVTTDTNKLPQYPLRPCADYIRRVVKWQMRGSSLPRRGLFTAKEFFYHEGARRNTKEFFTAKSAKGREGILFMLPAQPLGTAQV